MAILGSRALGRTIIGESVEPSWGAGEFYWNVVDVSGIVHSLLHTDLHLQTRACVNGRTRAELAGEGLTERPMGRTAFGACRKACSVRETVSMKKYHARLKSVTGRMCPETAQVGDGCSCHWILESAAEGSSEH